jgi:hypothetical protein
MATVAVSVTKSIPFQGGSEQFSNVYHFTTDLAMDALEPLVDAVVAAERLVHANNVTFIGAKCWNTSGIPNVMRVSKTLSGTGNSTAGNTMYEECAILVKWPLPRKIGLTKSTHRALRKWLHVGKASLAAHVSGNTGLGGIANINGLQGYIDGIGNAGSASTDLISPDGTLTSGPATLHPWLEHRQFKRGRKEGSGIL